MKTNTIAELTEQILYARYLEALADLRAMINDFTPGADQRFIQQQREVKARFDALWYAQRVADLPAQEAQP